MSRVFKQIILALLYYSGLLTVRDWIAQNRGNRRACVLMYHRVLDDPEAREEYAQTGIAVSTATFAAQVAYLARRYTVLTAGDYVGRLRRKEPLPSRCAVITFDDGWHDNFENAYPILKRYGIPATIFVCSDFVDSTAKFWFHDLLHAVVTQKLGPRELQAALETAADGRRDDLRIPEMLAGVYLLDHFLRLAKSLTAPEIDKLLTAVRPAAGAEKSEWAERRFVLSWDEIAAMEPDIVEIGSHGRSHRLLTGIPATEARQELLESKQILEAKTGRKVRVAAYPNGAYDETIKGYAVAAGYEGAFAVDVGDGEQDLFAVPRVGLHEGATAGLGGRFSRAKFALLLSRARRQPSQSARVEY